MGSSWGSHFRIRAGAVAASVLLLCAVSVPASAQEPADTATTSDQPATQPSPVAGAAKPGDDKKPGDGEPESGDPVEADINVRVDGLERGRALAGTTISMSGRITPLVKGERITMMLLRDGEVIKRSTRNIKAAKGSKKGRFSLESPRLLESGRYQFIARKKASKQQDNDLARSRDFKISYPDLDPGDSSDAVGAMRRLLSAQGYFAPGGSTYDSHLERAVLAFHKVNNMSRTTNASAQDFKRLAAGNGGFKLNSPGAGKHVEVDVSRQVMVLARDGKAEHIFHISTGAAATPSDYGHFRFYRKDPGYNSLGMFYSAYYNRGEATHGYHSVPTYPASHGCIRNPIPDSIFIYNWIDLGDAMIVYP